MKNLYKYTGEKINIDKFIGRTIYCEKSYDLFSVNPLININRHQLGELLNCIDLNNGVKVVEVNINSENLLYLYFDVKLSKKEKIILDMILPIKSKIWKNNILISIFGINTRNEKETVIENSVCVVMDKGVSEFIIEISNPQKLNQVSINILNYELEILNLISSLSSIGNRSNFQGINFVCKELICNKSKQFYFKYFMNDNIFDRIELNIYNTDKKKIYNLLPEENTIYIIDFKKLDEKESLICNYLFEFLCYNGKSIKKEFFWTVIGADIYKLVTYLTKRIEDNKIKDDGILWRINQIEQFLNKKELISTFWECYHLYNILFNIDENIKEEADNKSRILTYNYKSKIDYQEERIHYRLPKFYNKNIKYPIFLHLSIGRYGWEAIDVNSLDLKAEFIYADVSVRDATMGMYMGMLNLLESISIIKKICSIDDNKVYLCGASNGGYAAWTILERLPYLFAGAYIVAGYPNISLINNCGNTYIINMMSNEDYAYKNKTNELKGNIVNKENYFEINMGNINHTQLLKYAVNKVAIELLIQHKRNKWPDKIYYKSTQNRFLRSYWITATNISFNKKTYEIFAEIVNNNIIIKVSNTDNFIITIPPQINRIFFSIIINSIKYRFNNYYKNKIFFKRVNKEYFPVKFLSITKNYYIQKGTGLLDVYNNYDLKIVIPFNYNETIYNIAKNLSRPYSFANNGVIAVEYPILIDKNYRYNKKDNLIIIDINNSNKLTKYKIFLYHIKFTKEGFYYKNNFYKGKYVIFQCIENKINHNMSILHISSNYEDELKRNLFLRKMFLCSDVYGMNPYLNNMALIYFNRKYYKVYEWNSNLEVINNIVKE